MRILVLNADYPRFLAWFYRRQPGLENTSYAAQMAARNASLFGVADFYSRNFTALDIRRRRSTSTIHGCNRHGRARTAWQFEIPEPPGGDGHRELPRWLQRAAKPLKPLLRPLARKVGLSPSLMQRPRKYCSRRSRSSGPI